MIRLILYFLILPLIAYADKHIPYYKSLAHDESWLRHYPENQDLSKQTEKFLLTEENMPVKIIEEFQNSWSSYTDWYRIELFNGIQGWIAHNQLSKKRTLLVLEDTELYALKSYDPESLLTIQKGLILAPKIVYLLEVNETMVKISIPEGKKSLIKGWIPIDKRPSSAAINSSSPRLWTASRSIWVRRMTDISPITSSSGRTADSLNC